MEKILIIDDDVTFSLMLRTWLGKKGFGVDTAAVSYTHLTLPTICSV